MERIWSKVAKAGADECWPWTHGKTLAGYGQTTVNGEKRLAHRLAWELAVGPIPAGLCILHRCDNPPCCNPAHLFLGTKKDNAADAIAKGRPFGRPRQTHCNRGHEFTEENTFRLSGKGGGGTRCCRTCRYQMQRDKYHRRKNP